jgi:pantoate--beta-alanine ligase
MIIFKRTAELTSWVEKQRVFKKSIGFVPTMGALHAGHISLITISKSSNQSTVCSIFINPTQFNDPADFEKYPVTLESDIALLERAGVDVLFLPPVPELYPTGTTGLEHYDLGRLETLLEGKYRPGHFQGVCQVMSRLLRTVRPDHLYMGQKDYQQCMVVDRLINGIALPVRLHKCPIVREPDGLAMSSRNLRLSPTQRLNATAIYKALIAIQMGWRSGATPKEGLVAARTNDLQNAGFKVDYIEIADAGTLEPIGIGPRGVSSGPESVGIRPGAVIDEPQPVSTETGAVSTETGAVALIAAFQGEIRLIDNLIL